MEVRASQRALGGCADCALDPQDGMRLLREAVNFDPRNVEALIFRLVGWLVG